MLYGTNMKGEEIKVNQDESDRSQKMLRTLADTISQPKPPENADQIKK